jgi:predicted nuclease of restriction endonuclease-like (RecB) superfamily
MESEIEKSNPGFVSDVKTILEQARRRAYQAVNTTMVQAYWLVGKRIVQEEQEGKERANYGEAILKTLSIALTAEFGKGFSYANLNNFRQFYLTYPDQENCSAAYSNSGDSILYAPRRDSENPIGYTLRSQLTWTHHRLIMRVQNAEARAYYLKECETQNWSTRQLERNINTFYYQRVLSTKGLAKTAEPGDQQQIADFIKDPYVFEFLNIEQNHPATELVIETALIHHLEKFLLELGKGFSYVGRQYRISTETDHFYIDLVFYNYLLKCFVLIDLKTGKLQHEHIGQMDMYRRMFDDLKKPEGDNPTIGILLCTDKSETVVKYSVMSDNKQLFASKYMPYLPTEQELIAEIERDKMIIEKGIEE